MNHIEDEYEGVDGIKLYYQAWIPDNPKAVVQVIHGFAEHSGRYKNVVNQLVPKGYIIYAHDLRGHGKSEGIQNYVDSMDQFVEDEKRFYDIIKKKHANLKIFMLGHSMGSGIAMYFTKKYEDLLAGLILSGTAKYFGGEAGKMKKAFAKQTSKTFPKLRASSGVDPLLLSHDPQEVEAYKNDPLVHYKKITARLGWEMIKSFEEAAEIVGHFKIPVLIQRGAEDSVMTGTEELKDAFSVSDLTYKEYEGLYHEIYNELEKDRTRVLKDLVDWLDKHL
ncbi:MAG: alpha/beta hydrolase [Promethearchaeota archaeon]|nr:MAG: alpha/beta hydrolase [Candidatus Lokiarchaeota archaeon]